MKQGELIWFSIKKKQVDVTLFARTLDSQTGYRPTNSTVQTVIQAYYQTVSGTEVQWADEGLRKLEWMKFWTEETLVPGSEIQIPGNRNFEIKKIIPCPTVNPVYYHAFGVIRE